MEVRAQAYGAQVERDLSLFTRTAKAQKGLWRAQCGPMELGPSLALTYLLGLRRADRRPQATMARPRGNNAYYYFGQQFYFVLRPSIGLPEHSCSPVRFKRKKNTVSTNSYNIT